MDALEDRVMLSGLPDPGNLALAQIDHFVVIYQENWSFDSLYGDFPGANGLDNAEGAGTIPQVDKSGNPLTTLPDPSTNPPVPGGLPVQPYDLSQYIAPTDHTNDLIHRFYHQQLQIDNGALQPSNGSMDKFVTWSDNGTLVQSYFDATNLPEGQLAQQYTMDDNFFHAAYGGSFLNAQFLISAAAPPLGAAHPGRFPVELGSHDPDAQRQQPDGRWEVRSQHHLRCSGPAPLVGAVLQAASTHQRQRSLPAGLHPDHRRPAQ
jgi:acid phosphatase